MLDGNHAHGGIRANEVAIAGINYAGITAREAVLLVLGAKGAEYGLQAGNFLLMRTRAGAWVVKQGERAIVLTTEQVGKLRQAIRNATKAGDKLTDAQVDDLLLVRKGMTPAQNEAVRLLDEIKTARRVIDGKRTQLHELLQKTNRRPIEDMRIESLKKTINLFESKVRDWESILDLFI